MGITTAQPQALDVTTKQLSDGNGLQGGGGTLLGISAQDEIGFYGKAPIQQPTGPGQKALVRGNAGGVIAYIQPAVASPSAVNNITTAEKSLTLGPATAVFQVATSDLLYINKPTSQAGLGVGNVRVSAANTAGVTFSNYTAATITPTASEQYSVVAVRGMNTLSANLTPAAVAPNTTLEQQFTVAGLRSGSLSMVQVSKPTAQAGLDIAGVRVVADNTVGVTFVNVTAATITPTAAEAYTFFDMAGLDAVNNMLVYQALQSPVSVANATTAEQALTFTGLLTTDVVVGISKPTAQAGLFIGGMRVSAANSLGITFGNVTAASITPTATESYAVSVFRQAPVAPLVVYSVSLAPVSVANNTTAEQTFTVTGLLVNTPVWVNKPSAQPGLGIVGVRVSAANTLAINYGNSSAATITPATETYIVGNFQIPATTTSGAVVQPVSVTSQSQSILDNSMRLALVNEGLIAGG
jgi:hypothetical protein